MRNRKKEESGKALRLGSVALLLPKGEAGWAPKPLGSSIEGAEERTKSGITVGPSTAPAHAKHVT